MTLDFNFLTNFLLIYLFLFTGVFLKYFVKINEKIIGKFLIYLLAPIVIFHGTLNTTLISNVIFLPILIFLISSFVCYLFYFIGKKIWNDSNANILAILSSEGNTGYFGLPIAILLFNNELVGIYIFALMGVTLFENSVVYYLTARGRYSKLHSLYKLLKLPAIYAFIAGLIFNFYNIKNIKFLDSYIDYIQDLYSFLGMMIVGLCIYPLSNLSLDKKMVLLSFLGKFIIWPILILFFIYFNENFFHFFSHEVYAPLILVSIVPIAVNTVVFATVLNVYPRKVASTVLLSTIFSIIYIPLCIYILNN